MNRLEASPVSYGASLNSHKTIKEASVQTEPLTPIQPIQVAPIEPQAASDLTLGRKLYDYFRMLSDDKDYRRGFFAMMTNQCGDGLITGGVLYLLSTLAVLNPQLSVIGISVFTLVEIAIAAVSYLYASHARDNTEQAKREGNDGSLNQIKHGHRLCMSGLIDGLSSALLLGGIIAVSSGTIGAPVIFVAVVAVKAVQAYNKNFENGAWHCLKYNLGRPETQEKQLKMRATIGALELGTGGMTYGLVSLGTLLVVTSLAASAPALVPFVSIGAAVIGGMMTCLPKMMFGRYAVTRAVSTN